MDPTFFFASTLLSQVAFITVHSAVSQPLSALKSFAKSLFSVFPSFTSWSITHCFTTLSNFTGYHCSPLTRAPARLDVSQRVCYLALLASSLSANTTSILSPGPGRRHLIVSFSVTLLTLSPARRLSLMTLELLLDPLDLPISIGTALSSCT